MPQAGSICEAYLLVRPQRRQQSQRRQQIRVLPEGHLLGKLPAQGQRPAVPLPGVLPQTRYRDALAQRRQHQPIGRRRPVPLLLHGQRRKALAAGNAPAAPRPVQHDTVALQHPRR